SLSNRDAVIVAAVRSPVGRRKGSLATVHPADLSAHVLNALVATAGLDPVEVEDVIWGCVEQVGAQSNNIARTAVLAAGWPESVAGTTVHRQCGSSQQSVHFAAAGLIAGQYDVVVAGGVEMMTQLPIGAALGEGLGDPNSYAVKQRYGVEGFNQGLGAEMMAQRWGFTRERLDEFALSSHEKAAAATRSGAFADEIAPITLPDGTVFSTDEGVRIGGTLDSLGKLKTPFAEDGVITAGNASQISDGAAGLLMTTSEAADRLGLTPLARVSTAVIAADDPVIMLTAPMPATRKALARAGLSIGDIGAFEVNEAFAPVPLAWLQEVGADEKALNPNGGAIALGHPMGASGARLMTTLVHHMHQNEIRFGLQTMCEGGGMANATIVELI
ncbi:MAG: acetyl-CoA acyltransferase, partial [Actinomycetota bacterium]|nr:acetyl-CoA acyltransferase [Actinomycetota bacterium]